MLKEITNKLGQKKVYDLRSVSTRKIRRQQMKAQAGSNRIQQLWSRMMAEKGARA